MKTFVVIPTYNEAENLPLIAAELWALEVDDLHLVIVDDDSPDGTGDIAEELKARRPDQMHVIHRKGKRGLGSAYIAGFRYALSQNADYIVQMDADFSHSPRHILTMLDTISDYDVVVGSRYVTDGKTDEQWGIGRLFLSWWANIVYTQLILGIKVKDATAGFKCWKSDTLRGMGLDRVRSNGYVFQVEMAYLTEKLGYMVTEIPIYFEDRRVGKSKMTAGVKCEAVWRVWEMKLRHRGMSPSKRRLSR